MASQDIEGEIVVGLKHLSKKSEVTKAKALTNLQNLFSVATDNQLAPYVGGFVERYCLDIFHFHHQVRSLLNNVLSISFGKQGKAVKSEYGSLLKYFIGPWVSSMNDMDANVKSSAIAAFNVAFQTPAKQSEALEKTYDFVLDFCQLNLEQLHGVTIQDELDPNLNLVCATLGTLGYLLRTVPSARSRIEKDYLWKEGVNVWSPVHTPSRTRIPKVFCTYLSLMIDIVLMDLLDMTAHGDDLLQICQSALQSNTDPDFLREGWRLVLQLARHKQYGPAIIQKLVRKEAFQASIQKAVLSNERLEVIQVFASSLMPYLAVATKDAIMPLDLAESIVESFFERVQSSAAGSTKVSPVAALWWPCLCECWELLCLRQQQQRGSASGSKTDALLLAMATFVVKLPDKNPETINVFLHPFTAMLQKVFSKESTPAEMKEYVRSNVNQIVKAHSTSVIAPLLLGKLHDVFQKLHSNATESNEANDSYQNVQRSEFEALFISFVEAASWEKLISLLESSQMTLTQELCRVAPTLCHDLLQWLAAVLQEANTTQDVKYFCKIVTLFLDCCLLQQEEDLHGHVREMLDLLLHPSDLLVGSVLATHQVAEIFSQHLISRRSPVIHELVAECSCKAVRRGQFQLVFALKDGVTSEVHVDKMMQELTQFLKHRFIDGGVAFTPIQSFEGGKKEETSSTSSEEEEGMERYQSLQVEETAVYLESAIELLLEMELTKKARSAHGPLLECILGSVLSMSPVVPSSYYTTLAVLSEDCASSDEDEDETTNRTESQAVQHRLGLSLEHFVGLVSTVHKLVKSWNATKDIHEICARVEHCIFHRQDVATDDFARIYDTLSHTALLCCFSEFGYIPRFVQSPDNWLSTVRDIMSKHLLSMTPTVSAFKQWLAKFDGHFERFDIETSPEVLIQLHRYGVAIIVAAETGVLMENKSQCNEIILVLLYLKSFQRVMSSKVASVVESVLSAALLSLSAKQHAELQNILLNGTSVDRCLLFVTLLSAYGSIALQEKKFRVPVMPCIERWAATQTSRCSHVTHVLVAGLIQFDMIVCDSGKVVVDAITVKTKNILEEVACSTNQTETLATMRVIVLTLKIAQEALMHHIVGSIVKVAGNAGKSKPEEALALLSDVVQATHAEHVDLCPTILHIMSNCCVLQHLPSNGRLGQRVPTSAPIPIEVLEILSYSIRRVYMGMKKNKVIHDELAHTILLYLFDSMCEFVRRLKIMKTSEELSEAIDCVSGLSSFLSHLKSYEIKTIRASEKASQVIVEALFNLHSWVGSCPAAQLEQYGLDHVLCLVSAVCQMASLTLLGSSLTCPDEISLIAKTCPLSILRGEIPQQLKVSYLAKVRKAVGKSAKQRVLLLTYLTASCIFLSLPGTPGSPLHAEADASARYSAEPLLTLVFALGLTSRVSASKAWVKTRRVEDSFLCSPSEELSVFEHRPRVSCTISTLHQYMAHDALRVVPLIVQGSRTSQFTTWMEHLDRSMSQRLETFIEQSISPVLVQSAIAEILAQGKEGATSFTYNESFKITVDRDERIVLVEFEKDDAVASVRILVPSTYPLKRPFIAQHSGLKITNERSWILKMRFGYVTVWEWVKFFCDNMASRYEHVDPCPICCAIISTTDRKPPEMQCAVCKNVKFHKSCLYHWWRSSGSSQCPTCRTPWYTG